MPSEEWSAEGNGDGEGDGRWAPSTWSSSSSSSPSCFSLRGTKHEEVAEARRGFQDTCLQAIDGGVAGREEGGAGMVGEGTVTVMRGEEGGEGRRRGGTGRMGGTRRMVRGGVEGCKGVGDREGRDEKESVEVMALGGVKEGGDERGKVKGRGRTGVWMRTREQLTTLWRVVKRDCWLKARTGDRGSRGVAADGVRWVMWEERPCVMKKRLLRAKEGSLRSGGGNASNGRGVETPTPGDVPLMTREQTR